MVNSKDNDKKSNKLAIILIVLGIMVCLYPLFTSLRSYYEQRQFRAAATSDLNTEINPGSTEIIKELTAEDPARQLERETGPAQIIAESGTAMMELEIPAIKVSVMVVNGVGKSDLEIAPGWYPQSALPGEGNTAIAGHRTMYGGWFKNLYKLKANDEIYLDYKNKKYIYLVEKVFPIQKDDWSVINPTPDAVLTLTTCQTVGNETHRLAVRAKLKN